MKILLIHLKFFEELNTFKFFNLYFAHRFNKIDRHTSKFSKYSKLQIFNLVMN